MRLGAALVSVMLADIFGLLTWEAIVLFGLAVAIGLGVFNLVNLGRQADAIRKLQDAQSARIDLLPPPPGE